MAASLKFAPNQKNTNQGSKTGLGFDAKGDFFGLFPLKRNLTNNGFAGRKFSPLMAKDFL